MKKILSAISMIIFAASIFAQITFEGPANGSISSGVVISTETFAKKSFTGSQRLKLFIHNQPIAVEEGADKVVPTMKEGENFIEDPRYKRNSLFKANNKDSVVIFRSFEGIEETNSIPPDPYLAVGPNHIVQVVNSEFRISDKKGNTIKTIDADEWYASALTGASAFDPKITYDHFDKRWIMTWLHVNDAASESYYLFSVSDDENPVGVWYNWAIPSNTEGNTMSGNWGDYPGVGFDEKAVYLTSNQFPFADEGDIYPKIRIIDKKNIYINGNPGTLTWTDFWKITFPRSVNSAFGIRPARMHETSDNGEFYLACSRWFGETNSSTALFKINDPIGTPTLTGTAIATAEYSRVPSPKQLEGGDIDIESGGIHIRNEPVYRGGLLHITHTAKYNTVSGVRYLAIEPVIDAAIVDFIMGTPEHFHLYSALAVNSNNDVILSYSRSSENEYTGAYYAVVHSATELPTGSYTLQQGLANYVKDYSSGRNRWGDYNGAWVDPKDDLSFWVMSEYAVSKNTWANRVGGVRAYPFNEPYVRVDKSILEFDLTEVQKPINTKILKVANLGKKNLSISKISIGNSDFKIKNNLTFPISLGPAVDTLYLELEFSPTSHGIITDTLVIESNSQISIDTKTILTGEGYYITPVSKSKLYASTGRGSGSVGRVISVNTTTGEGTVLGESGYKPLRSATINPLTNELVAVNPVLGEVPTFIRIRGNDGRGYFFEETPLEFNTIEFDKAGLLHCITKDKKYYTMDFTTFDTTFIAEMPFDIIAMSFHPTSGELYATTAESSDKDRIYKISAAGDTTLFGRTGLGSRIEALAFDDNGNLFGTTGSETQFSKLIKINTSTAAGTELGAVGFRGVLGLAFAFDGIVGLKDKFEIPSKFDLAQNYPNPFNPSTNIEFSLPLQSKVSLTVYNLLGEVVAELLNTVLPAGMHSYKWNAANSGKNLSSGVYIYSLKAVDENGKEISISKKMMLLK
ncbi:MAG: T9SS type A sorting domain-containing protein [Bacteroidetes bacterium]|nr:T9SS type A sorting domain-containing protein [Bacteroidota bacterium]MBU1678053.1 T9SS type A sorting domain-containing protein [Bacteroidota bacterium]